MNNNWQSTLNAKHSGDAVIVWVWEVTHGVGLGKWTYQWGWLTPCGRFGLPNVRYFMECDLPDGPE